MGLGAQTAFELGASRQSLSCSDSKFFFRQRMDRPEATVATSLAHENTRERFRGLLSSF